MLCSAFMDCTRHAEDAIALEVTAHGAERVTLVNIEVAEELRGRGIGSAALRKLTELADHFGVTLDVEARGGLELIDDVAWYSRHGFEWRHGYMERDPQDGTEIDDTY